MIEKEKIDLYDKDMKWVDRSGKIWNIQDMEGDHLRNTIKYIDKRVDELEEETDYGSYGDPPHISDLDLFEYSDFCDKTRVCIGRLKDIKGKMSQEFIKRLMEGEG